MNFLLQEMDLEVTDRGNSKLSDQQKSKPASSANLGQDIDFLASVTKGSTASGTIPANWAPHIAELSGSISWLILLLSLSNNK